MGSVAALDIGGTKVAGGIVDEDGKVMAYVKVATRSAGTGDALFEEVAGVLERVLEDPAAQGVGSVGVACAGPMTRSTVSPVNIIAWRDFPLRARLEERFGLDVEVDNDAKGFAAGEGWLGAARGHANYVGIVVSTGVGGGIVVDGRLLGGNDGNAGHIGHIVVNPGGMPCACGAFGCVEAEGSGTAIARKAFARCVVGNIDSGPLYERFRQLSEDRPSQGSHSVSTVGGLTAADVAAAAGEGDRAAIEIFEESGQAVGRGIGAVATLLDLRLAVVGGGVSAAGDLLFEPMRAAAAKWAQMNFTVDLEIVPAGLVDAGLVGAAALHFTQ